MSIDELIEAIRSDTQWLDDAHGNEIKAISIENLEIILSMFLKEPIEISQDER